MFDGEIFIIVDYEFINVDKVVKELCEVVWFFCCEEDELVVNFDFFLLWKILYYLRDVILILE